jgi:glycogen debranching enzyme
MSMNQQKIYPYAGVALNEQHSTTESLEIFTWQTWASRIDENFEKYFWIDENSNESVHINRRQTYKDTLNASIPWMDYQLRPNFLIALCLAPSMVNRQHARTALENCRKHLFADQNSIGIKTLDPSDYNYCGFYDNTNNSKDPRISHGYNYHQGPEWLWPIGYYLRAQMLYSIDKDDTIRHVKRCLARYNHHVMNSEWKSLPELTNENGVECQFSCPSQAWSVATLLEACFCFTKF